MVMTKAIKSVAAVGAVAAFCAVSTTAKPVIPMRAEHLLDTQANIAALGRLMAEKNMGSTALQSLVPRSLLVADGYESCMSDPGKVYGDSLTALDSCSSVPTPSAACKAAALAYLDVVVDVMGNDYSDTSDYNVDWQECEAVQVNLASACATSSSADKGVSVYIGCAASLGVAASTCLKFTASDGSPEEDSCACGDDWDTLLTGVDDATLDQLNLGFSLIRYGSAGIAMFGAIETTYTCDATCGAAMESFDLENASESLCTAENLQAGCVYNFYERFYAVVESATTNDEGLGTFLCGAGTGLFEGTYVCDMFAATDFNAWTADSGFASDLEACGTTLADSKAASDEIDINPTTPDGDSASGIMAAGAVALSVASISLFN